MEIISKNIEVNDKKLEFANTIVIGMLTIVIIIGLVLFTVSMIKLKGRKRIGAFILSLIYLIIIVIPIVLMYGNLVNQSKEIVVKVQGEAKLEKFESINSDDVIAKLKGRSNNTINIYLDKNKYMNLKDHIRRGDTLYIDSNEKYSLIKMRKSIFDIDNNKNNDNNYILKKDSELREVNK